jgi:hypothetical protein
MLAHRCWPSDQVESRTMPRKSCVFKKHKHSHSRRRPSGPQQVYFTPRPKANRDTEPVDKLRQRASDVTQTAAGPGVSCNSFGQRCCSPTARAWLIGGTGECLS